MLCSATLLALYLISFVPGAPLSAGVAASFLLVLVPPFLVLLLFNMVRNITQPMQWTFIPIRHRVAFFALFIFTGASFLTYSGSAIPEVRNGKYVLTSHGKVIRETNEQGYEAAQRRGFRGFAGHVVLFLYGAGIALSFRPPEGWLRP